jgi:hypothetical protein
MSFGLRYGPGMRAVFAPPSRSHVPPAAMAAGCATRARDWRAAVNATERRRRQCPLQSPLEKGTK